MVIMNDDIMGNIISRLEGTALASMACTSCEFRDLAEEESHWKRLCNSAWPSTASKQINELISCSVASGFHEFYAKSYPLIVYDHKATPIDVQTSSPGGLVSLVDVFVNDECVLSRVFDGIPQAVDISDDRLKDVANLDNTTTEDRSKEMAKVLILSWILLEKNSGKAVNLSTFNPILVRRDGAHDGDYLAEFGCIVRIEQTKSGKCIKTARFNVGADCIEARSLNWRELRMEIEDIEGSKLSEEKIRETLKRALSSFRSTNQLKVKVGFRKYEEEKSSMLKRKEFTQKLTDRVFLLL